jgi:hypothetical protein
LSLKKAKTSDSSTRATHGIASSSMLIGSGLGVATAANRKTQKIIMRRHLANRACVSTPATFSMANASGSSKAMPKMVSMAVA